MVCEVQLLESVIDIGKKMKNITRRQFLKGSIAGALSFPYIIPNHVFGKTSISPSEKITIGCIGVGWMGTSNMENFLLESDAQIVAVCDVDKNHLTEAKRKVDNAYGNKDCITYHDFRELISREDIDVISLGLPDHWHAIPAIAAANAGKDVYGEKPLSHSLVEGRAMCDAIKRNRRIWQTGSWQRSEPNFRFACELVRNGRIGKIHTVEVGLPSGHTDFAGTAHLKHIQQPPKELDYNFWLGPAPYAPYAVARVHKNWRWLLDYGGGQIMDWVGHHVDIAHWGMDMDRSGPVEINGHGIFPKTGLWNTATRYKVYAKYKNDIQMIIAGGYREIRGGTKWIGEYGWVRVDRNNLDAHPKSLLREKFDHTEIHLYKSPGHVRNFLDCVKNRNETITPCETAHRSATPGHLGQISMLLGRKIRFNPETEEIIDDPIASKLLGTPMRSPWHL